jgi:hypothetical protein
MRYAGAPCRGGKGSVRGVLALDSCFGDPAGTFSISCCSSISSSLASCKKAE